MLWYYVIINLSPVHVKEFWTFRELFQEIWSVGWQVRGCFAVLENRFSIVDQLGNVCWQFFFFFFFFLSNSKLLFFVWGNELGFKYSSIRINLPKLFHTFSFKLSSAVLRGELNLTLLFVMTLLLPTNIHPSTVFTATGSLGSPT